MNLFDLDLSLDWLRENSIPAIFDEQTDLFILEEDNCIYQGGIIIFKQPIYIKRVKLLCRIIDRTVIVKDEVDDEYEFLLAMTVSNSDEDREELYNFFDHVNCRAKDCWLMLTHTANWGVGTLLQEVCHEIL